VNMTDQPFILREQRHSKCWSNDNIRSLDHLVNFNLCQILLVANIRACLIRLRFISLKIFFVFWRSIFSFFISNVDIWTVRITFILKFNHISIMNLLDKSVLTFIVCK
jgi:hypothetical protein